MSKLPKKPTGRPTTDDRGNATWKWAGDTIDNARVKRLGDELSLDSPPAPGPSIDPYNQSASPRKEETKRRSLDDMRRLDAEMKLEHEKLVRQLRQRAHKKQW